jgi:cytochrome P450
MHARSEPTFRLVSPPDTPPFFSNLTSPGVDMVIIAVYNTMHHQNLEGWRKFFSGDNYTVEGRPAGQRIILTADVENIKAILATQFQDFGKGEDFHKDWSEFLGDSIFTTDTEKWHASRQLIRPQFIKDRVSDLEVFEEHVQILIKAIANGGVKGAPGVATDGIGKGRLVDVSDLFFRYTLDAATDFLLGHSVGSLEVPIQDFAEAFSEVQRVQNIIARAGYVHFHYLSTPYCGRPIQPLPLPYNYITSSTANRS